MNNSVASSLPLPGVPGFTDHIKQEDNPHATQDDSSHLPGEGLCVQYLIAQDELRRSHGLELPHDIPQEETGETQEQEPVEAGFF